MRLFPIFIIPIFFLSHHIHSQNLSMGQFATLRKSDPISAEEFLIKKGWEYNGVTKIDNQKVEMTFVYHEDKYNRNTSGCNLIITNNEILYLLLTVENEKKYIEYLNEIKAFGSKLVNSEISEKGLTKVYKGATTTFYISIGSSDFYNSSVYNFYIYSNEIDVEILSEVKAFEGTRMFNNSKANPKRLIKYESIDDEEMMEEVIEKTDQSSSSAQEKSKSENGGLDMSGWKWDKIPTPNDATDETGKIVFEFEIDHKGTVVSIKTLEKTVSPLVEKIYRDEVLKTSFSKTSKNAVMPERSIGKITFVINSN